MAIVPLGAPAPSPAPANVAALNGTVTASLGNGSYAVRVGNAQLTVSSPVELLPKQEVSLQIGGNGAAVAMPRAANAAAMASGAAQVAATVADGVAAEFSVTISGKDLARVAREHPAVVAKAEIAFSPERGGSVTLRFADGAAIAAVLGDGGESAEALAAAIDDDAGDESSESGDASDSNDASDASEPGDEAGKAPAKPGARGETASRPAPGASRPGAASTANAVEAAAPAAAGAVPATESAAPGVAGLRRTLVDCLQKFFRPVGAAPLTAEGNFALRSVQVPLEFAAAGGAATATVEMPLDAFAAMLAGAPEAADAAAPQGAFRLTQIDARVAVLQAGGQAVNLPLDGAPELRAWLGSLPRDAGEGGPLLTARLGETLTVRGRLDNVANPATAAPPAATPAVDRFIMMAGLTPSDATRAAAGALLGEGLAIDRQGVQTLLALAAGREGDERAGILAAGARLLKLDVPVSPAVAAGSAQAHDPAASVSGKVAAAREGLQAALAEMAPATPEGGADAGGAGAGAARPSGGDKVFAAVLEAVEGAQGALDDLTMLAGRADLPERLRNYFVSYARDSLAQAAGAVEDAAAAILEASPALRRLDAALEVALARLNHEPAPARPGGDGALAGGAAGTVPGAGAAAPASPQEAAARLRAIAALAGEGLPETSAPENGAETRAAHPGTREFPAAWREAAGGAAPDPGAQARVEGALRDILSAATPDEAAAKTQEAAKTLDTRALRELTAALQNLEKEEMANTPGLGRLAEAAAEIRDLGRMATAVKAENLAGQQADPAWCGAPVPFRMGGESGDGQLRMFYRRPGRGGQKNWSQRVVLDLDFSALGSVVGDMRFTADKKLSLVIGVRTKEALAAIAADQRELAAALAGVGFPCVPEFRLVTPPAAPAPAPAAPAASGSPAAPRPGAGLIDIQA